MGLFRRKKTKNKRSHNDGMNELVERHVFTADFREALRNHGRLYFEKIIRENGEIFKQELNSTATKVQSDMQAHLAVQLRNVVEQLNEQVKGYVATQLNAQLEHHNNTLKESQDEVLQSLSTHIEALKTQYQELGEGLQQKIKDQDNAINESLAINKAHVEEMRQAQELALKSITDSADALQQQYQQMSQMLERNVENQEQMLVDAFQDNMAQIIEHYLAGVITEQYDLKAQLPAIVKQMQAQQEEIAKDMKL